MVNWILLNEVPFKCIFTIIGSFLPSYSWIYRNPAGMWESPLLEWQPLSILHTAPMSPGELQQMHSSSQPPYDGCSFFIFQVNTTIISMAHESPHDGLCLPLCHHLLPSDIITIKIPNYSLSRFLHLHNFTDMLSFSTLLSELWPILQHRGQIQHFFQSLPDSSRQYYLPFALHPRNMPGVPLTWGLVFPVVRMSWYSLAWWAQVVGTLLTFLLFEIL